jgi:hypothetical protein
VLKLRGLGGACWLLKDRACRYPRRDQQRGAARPQAAKVEVLLAFGAGHMTRRSIRGDALEWAHYVVVKIAAVCHDSMSVSSLTAHTYMHPSCDAAAQGKTAGTVIGNQQQSLLPFRPRSQTLINIFLQTLAKSHVMAWVLHASTGVSHCASSEPTRSLNVFRLYARRTWPPGDGSRTQTAASLSPRAQRSR